MHSLYEGRLARRRMPSHRRHGLPLVMIARRIAMLWRVALQAPVALPDAGAKFLKRIGSSSVFMRPGWVGTDHMIDRLRWRAAWYIVISG